MTTIPAKRIEWFATSYAKLAEQFGVSTMTAHRAVTGAAWGHVE